MVGRRPVMYVNVQNLVLGYCFFPQRVLSFLKTPGKCRSWEIPLEVPGNFKKVYYVVCEIKFSQRKVNRDMVTVAKGGS